MTGHEQTIEGAFSAQADAYNTSPTTNATEILDALVEIAAPERSQSWLDAACGPGIVSRHLAPLVAQVHGVDITPAMVALARRSTERSGVGNATFQLADATATGLPDASFDGAVTRFSLHHLPLPGRLVREMARLVRVGGTVVIVDHVADEDGHGEARAWAQEIERLRDPAHWACEPATRMRRLGTDAGLTLSAERLVPFTIDFDEWLHRGTTDPDALRLVESALADPPRDAACFVIRDHDGSRTLTLQVWMGAYTVPEPSARL